MNSCQSYYKPKHPKRGEYKEQNGSTQVQENKKCAAWVHTSVCWSVIDFFSISSGLVNIIYLFSFTHRISNFKKI
jgi:hypothetical protein